MKTLSHNSVSRALHLLAYDYSDKMHRKRHANDSTRLTEVQQQFQLPISGVAGAGAYVDYDITFTEILYYAPLQRTNKNEDPQLWWGVQLDKGHAFFSVHVAKWMLDDSANYKGAHVRVGFMQGAYAGQGSVDGSEFAGTVHVTFQGLGVPVEAPGYDDTGYADQQGS